jgi:hypothetical protein
VKSNLEIRGSKSNALFWEMLGGGINALGILYGVAGGCVLLVGHQQNGIWRHSESASTFLGRLRLDDEQEWCW